MRTLSEKLGLLQGVNENPHIACECTDELCKKCRVESALKTVEAALDRTIADIDADG